MAAAALTRARYKIGEHELEIEGPTAFVDQHVERWARLAGLVSAPAAPVVETVDPTQQPVFSVEAPTAPTLAELFHFDAAKKLVVPRVVSPGRRRNSAAALLILYGYRQFLPKTPSVGASLFKDALAASGCQISRLDRVVERHLEAGLISKSGSRKREFYALTVAGEQRALALLRAHGAPKPVQPPPEAAIPS